MQNKTIYNLIAKKFSNEISEAEKAKLDSWITQSPENKKQFDKLNSIWKKSVDVNIDFSPDIPKAIERFKSNVRALERKKRRKVIQLTAYKIAASIIVLLGSVLLYLQLNQSSELIEVATDNTKTKHILLPDSSVVFLNNNTSIKYDEDFDERTIELNGEAFFEVKKQKGKSFIVKSNNTFTKVLGTSFNIKTSNEKDCCDEIAVLTGKVKFSSIDERSSAILTPNQHAVFKSNTSKIVVKELNSNSLAWKTGVINFENAPLEEVLKSLAEVYDVEYKVSSKEILEYKVTSEFDNVDIEEVIRGLEIILPIKIEFEKNIIEIKNK